MDKFKEKFIEEATDNINELEDALLELEKDGDNQELVERVFRAMHSLKGGGAMFGFTRLSDFTHHLENVYDMVREGKLHVTRDLLDITLESVDHLKYLLDDPEMTDPRAEALHNNLIVQVRKIVEEKPEDNAPEDKNEADTQEIKSYYIYFEPEEDIFNDGTNPLFLLDELHTLGDCKVFSHLNKLPGFEDLNVTKCYTYWEIFLATGEDVNAINDVFIFVEDQCTLEVHEITAGNILENESFVEEVSKLARERDDLGIGTIQQLLKTMDTPVEKATRGAAKKEMKSAARNGKEHAISSIRVSSSKLDHLMNLVSELVTTQARLSLFAEESGEGELLAIAENVQKLTRQLRDNAFDIVLVPIDTMLTRFQRLVRDLSNELNKEVDFVAEGTDTELDKTIIEGLTDPLLHILRNCLDHGIETTAERKKQGKPEKGKIVLKAFYSGANVHIQVHDDGKGMDAEAIRTKAIAKGLITENTTLSNKELMDLVFMPGFSTAKNVTDVSGRGVGMDVVKRKIAELRGEVELDSEAGVGTTLTIKLPLTLSIIDGLLVKIADNHYIIPLSVVDKIYSAKHEEVVDNFNNLIVLDGNRIPYYYLREEFGLKDGEQEYDQIVLVKYEDKQIGLAVDNVVGEYQAVLKTLGKFYKKQEIISGATILGDGTVALVMDTNKMITKFSNAKEQKNKI